MTGPSNDSNPDWVRRLDLQAHPEGGWYRRIYTSPVSATTAHGERRLASSIHYLLTEASPIGRLHRNRSDILHLLQAGGPVEYVVYRGHGAVERHRLGFGTGEALTLVVGGGHWKGSQLVDRARSALVTELVVPGFDWADHRFADAEWLERQPPAARAALAAFVASRRG